MSADQWLELLKAGLVAVGIYSAIRVDLAVLKVRVDRIERMLEK
jgi:hypothetical protein